jgi:hypothetical protein
MSAMQSERFALTEMSSAGCPRNSPGLLPANPTIQPMADATGPRTGCAELARMLTRSRIGWAVAATALVFVVGCVSGVYQTAETLPPGTSNWGGSVEAMLFTDRLDRNPTPVLIPAANLSMRRGLIDQSDCGLTWHLPLGLTADVKYQFLHGPVNGALVLPLTAFVVPIINSDLYTSSPDGTRMMAEARPTLLVSSRWLRAGAMLDLNTESWDERSHVHPGVLLGATIGSRTQLLPEVAVYPARRWIVWTIGCALTAAPRDYPDWP